jgi:hypothetical protein
VPDKQHRGIHLGRKFLERGQALPYRRINIRVDVGAEEAHDGVDNDQDRTLIHRVRKLINRGGNDISEQHNASNHEQPGTGSVPTQGDPSVVVVEGRTAGRYPVSNVHGGTPRQRFFVGGL